MKRHPRGVRETRRNSRHCLIAKDTASKKMTFKSLINFDTMAKDPYTPSIDRYHSGSGGYHHSGSGGYHHSGSGGYHHGSRGGHKSKGGGSGAALSALTLLAFLFLINVMQDNNSTATMMTTTGFIVRSEDQPLVLDEKEDNEGKEKRKEAKLDGFHETPAKSKIQRLNNQYIK